MRVIGNIKGNLLEGNHAVSPYHLNIFKSLEDNGPVYFEVDCLTKHKFIHRESSEAVVQQDGAL